MLPFSYKICKYKMWLDNFLKTISTNELVNFFVLNSDCRCSYSITECGWKKKKIRDAIFSAVILWFVWTTYFVKFFFKIHGNWDGTQQKKYVKEKDTKELVSFSHHAFKLRRLNIDNEPPRKWDENHRGRSSISAYAVVVFSLLDFWNSTSPCVQS